MNPGGQNSNQNKVNRQLKEKKSTESSETQGQLEKTENGMESTAGEISSMLQTIGSMLEEKGSAEGVSSKEFFVQEMNSVLKDKEYNIQLVLGQTDEDDKPKIYFKGSGNLQNLQDNLQIKDTDDDDKKDQLQFNSNSNPDSEDRFDKKDFTINIDGDSEKFSNTVLQKNLAEYKTEESDKQMYSLTYENGQPYVQIEKGTDKDDKIFDQSRLKHVIQAVNDSYDLGLDIANSDVLKEFGINKDESVSNRDGNVTISKDTDSGKIVFETKEDSSIPIEGQNRFTVTNGDKIDVASLINTMQQIETVESQSVDYGRFYNSAGVENWDLPDSADITYHDYSEGPNNTNGANLAITARNLHDSKDSGEKDKENKFSMKKEISLENDKKAYLVVGENPNEDEESPDIKNLKGKSVAEIKGEFKDSNMEAWLAKDINADEDGNIKNMDIQEVGDKTVHETTNVDNIDKGFDKNNPIYIDGPEGEEKGYKYEYGSDGETFNFDKFCPNDDNENNKLSTAIENLSDNDDFLTADVENVSDILPENGEGELFFRLDELDIDGDENKDSDVVVKIYKSGGNLKLKKVDDVEDKKESLGEELGELDIADLKSKNNFVKDFEMKDNSDKKGTIELKSINGCGQMEADFEIKSDEDTNKSKIKFTNLKKGGKQKLKVDGLSQTLNEEGVEDDFSNIVNHTLGSLQNAVVLAQKYKSIEGSCEKVDGEEKKLLKNDKDDRLATFKDGKITKINYHNVSDYVDKKDNLDYASAKSNLSKGSPDWLLNGLENDEINVD